CRSSFSHPRPLQMRIPLRAVARRVAPPPDSRALGGIHSSALRIPLQRSVLSRCAARFAPPGRAPLGLPKPTTPSPQSTSGFVITIPHPAHPLRGQRVEIIRVRRGLDPDLVIRLPDGFHAVIAASSTDYAAQPDLEIQSENPTPLLDLDGLCQIARLFAQLREQGRFPI